MQPPESSYYVVGNDGQKYGPADMNDLSLWAREGRINPGTWLEGVITHQRIPAGNVPGLFASYTHAQQSWSPVDHGAQNLGTTSILLALFSLFVCCVPFGYIVSPAMQIGGLVTGIMSAKRGNTLGTVGAVFNGLFLIVYVGMLILGISVYKQLFSR